MQPKVITVTFIKEAAGLVQFAGWIIQNIMDSYIKIECIKSFQIKLEPDAS